MAHNTRNTSFYIKRIIGLVLLLAMAAVFLFSGISKIYSIETFEWTFMDFGINSNTTAAILARLFIGLELMVGIFLLCHIYLKSFTYPVTLIMLLLLTGYLVVLIMQQGNTGNCGCFGDWIYMDPLSAIWKNIIMMAVTGLLMVLYPVKPYKNQEWIAAVLGMAALVVPLVVSPLNLDNQPVAQNRSINLSSLYTGHPQPPADLRKGKHIVAFMSLTCPHCRKAAFKLHTIHRNHPDIPMYIVLSGHPDQQEEFFKETKAGDVPHMLFRDTQAFGEMAGSSVPAIYWISDGVVEYESNYFQLDPAAMKSWLNK